MRRTGGSTCSVLIFHRVDLNYCHISLILCIHVGIFFPSSVFSLGKRERYRAHFVMSCFHWDNYSDCHMVWYLSGLLLDGNPPICHGFQLYSSADCRVLPYISCWCVLLYRSTFRSVCWCFSWFTGVDPALPRPSLGCRSHWPLTLLHCWSVPTFCFAVTYLQ